MKTIPYATQWIEEDDIKTVANALKTSNLTQGPLVEEFEKKVAVYCNAKYAVATNSGTSALHIANLAAGISSGNEVITSPNTFVATPNSVLYCGAKPVFADITEDTSIIDINEIKKKITGKTKVIIPVDFAGHSSDMQEIYSIAKENNLIVIEDAAHSLGAKYRVTEGNNKENWKKVGSCAHSDMTIFSFHPVKLITTGEGGMVLTNNEDLYEKLAFFRSHGITRDPKYMKKSDGPWYYEMHELGHNYRITDFQCALGINQLRKLDSFIKRRREIADIYNNAFRDIKNLKVLKEKEGVCSSYHLYVILTEQRNKVFNYLREKSGITVNVHYIPVYLQPYYQKLGYKKGLCPKAEKYYSKAISIPMYPKLSDEELEYVIKEIKSIV